LKLMYWFKNLLGNTNRKEIHRRNHHE